MGARLAVWGFVDMTILKIMRFKGAFNVLYIWRLLFFDLSNNVRALY